MMITTKDQQGLEELRRLHAEKDDLHSDAEGHRWLERVSGLLHRLAPERAEEFDGLTPFVLAPLSEATMKPIWYRMGAVIQAAIVEVEARSEAEERLPAKNDAAYLEQLIATGQTFRYRQARTRDRDDPTWERSREAWTEWFTQAELAVQTFAEPGSKALELLREAKRLESFGEIADDFYRCRELAVSALRVCLRDLRGPQAQRSDVLSIRGHTDSSPAKGLWDRYGREIVIGVVVTVIGGVLLALLL
jgi:hypothetical protein